MPLGAARLAYVLWTRHLRHNPKNPEWPDRDRFVLSGGHGSVLLYSLLLLTGYDLTLEDLKHFRQWGSRTPGIRSTATSGRRGDHRPARPGIWQRRSAWRWRSAGLPRRQPAVHAVVDHYTYVIATDGDMMEGVAGEAASLAGTLRLGRLIVLYDANGVTLAGTTNLPSRRCRRALRGVGWHTQRVDGHDVGAVDGALTGARAVEDQPSLIVAAPISATAARTGRTPFRRTASRSAPRRCVRRNARSAGPRIRRSGCRGTRSRCFGRRCDRGAEHEASWQPRLDGVCVPSRGGMGSSVAPWRGTAGGLGVASARVQGRRWRQATRDAGGAALDAFAGVIPNLIGGSADLDPSTRTVMKGRGDFESPLGPHR